MTIELHHPDEVVTKALLRLVNVPGLAKPAAVITLDNGLDYKKPNVFGPAGMLSLNDAITRLQRRGITVLLSGVTPGQWQVMAALGTVSRLRENGLVFADTPTAIAHARAKLRPQPAEPGGLGPLTPPALHGRADPA